MDAGAIEIIYGVAIFFGAVIGGSIIAWNVIKTVQLGEDVAVLKAWREKCRCGGDEGPVLRS